MNTFEKLYKELKRKYGMPKGQWVLWCKRPKIEREREKVIIEAILTQRTNWKNVELALNNLEKAKINPAPFNHCKKPSTNFKGIQVKKYKRCRVNSLKNILRLGTKKLAPLIRPSGFYQAKANYLFYLVEFILKGYGNLERMRKVNLKELREQLLKLRGIGPETADSILLYALDKPVFVIDEYTRRIVKKRNLANNLSYPFLQKLFEEKLKKDFRLYQDFHGLIVIDGKNKK